MPGLPAVEKAGGKLSKQGSQRGQSWEIWRIADIPTWFPVISIVRLCGAPNGAWEISFETPPGGPVHWMRPAF